MIARLRIDGIIVYEEAVDDGRPVVLEYVQGNTKPTTENKHAIMFDEFRKAYPGKKRGLRHEFENFQKKNKADWKEILPKLMGAVMYQKEMRAKHKAAGKFVPEWKNLQTWINGACWTEEWEEPEKKWPTFNHQV